MPVVYFVAGEISVVLMVGLLNGIFFTGGIYLQWRFLAKMMTTQEDFGGLCYKKCSILSGGSHPCRSSAWSCCVAG